MKNKKSIGISCRLVVYDSKGNACLERKCCSNWNAMCDGNSLLKRGYGVTYKIFRESE